MAASPAAALFDRINQDYWDAKEKLYRDAFSIADPDDQPAFNWGVGVTLSALNALAKTLPAAKARREEWLPAIEGYWNDAPPVGGFDVLPGDKDVDRYYDDNAWMVLAMIDAYQDTRERRWLVWALKSLDYSLSGWSGAGIYWRESDKASVNTCSNAPVAAACLRAFGLTKDDRYRESAFRILDWLLPTLQDPQDGLLWDARHNDGRIDKTKWSYNTALTIRAMADAEKLGWKPGGPGLTSREVWQRAWAHWFDSKTGLMKDEGRFAHLLVDVGLDYDLISKEDQKKLRSALEGLAVNGRYGSRWDRQGTKERFELIDQASVLRILARLDEEQAVRPS